MFTPEPVESYINKTAPKPSDIYSCSPNGSMYRKDIEGVVPLEITKVFLQRKEWKKKMLAVERNMEKLKEIIESKSKA